MAPSARSAGLVPSLLAARFSVVAFGAAAIALAACAAPSSAAAAGQEFAVRVVVKLAHPSDDTAAIAAEASRQAGVEVRYGAAVSSAWHALSLHCPDAAACEAAIVRLRQSSVYTAVELDARKQRVVM
jgi:hypothetical protein